MGIPLTSPADQSVRRQRQCLLFGTDPEALARMNTNSNNAVGRELVFEYTDESGHEIVITGFHKEVSGHVIIPSVIDGVPVTNISLIGNFSEINSEITSIYIPYSVNRIHPRIFDYCINLLTIVVSESNSQYLAFDGFLMDKSATKLIGCCRTKQGKAIIPSSVIEINDSAFANCSQLESIIIPNSVITIGAFSFGNCNKLFDLLIPESVIKLGKHAFSECSSLLRINISSYLREIGEGAYAGCDSINTITVSGDNLCFNEINDVLYASEKTRLIACNKKKSGELFIPITVINIDDGAFSGCSAITSIIIPASVTSIGYENFNGCTSLVQITVDDANSSYSTSDGVLFCDSHKYDRSIIKYPARKKGAFTIPRSVKSIAYSAFADCTELTDIIFHDGIKEISYKAFSGCSSLTSISIPKSVRMINNRAFYNCTELANIYTTAFAGTIASCAFENCNKLTLITIEENYQNHPEEWGRTTIEPLAFKGCPMLNLFLYRVCDKAVEIIRCNTSILHHIVIPNEIDGRPVTEIGFAAFEDCVGLTKVTIPDSLREIDFHSFSKVTDLVINISKEINPNFPRVDGVLFNREKTSLIRYDPTKQGSYIIPETVIEVSSMAFSGCDKLSGILIPNSVNAIGDYAFEYCAGITNITIPSSVKEISNGVFSNCNCLTSISIPDTLNKIGEYAFKDCTSLTNIIIPASVNHIGAGAFEGCKDLLSIVFPRSVTHISNSVFSGCSLLDAIIVDPSNSKYASLDGVLFNKFFTTLIKFPEGKFGNYAIPESVTKIEKDAFCNCKGLVSVTIPECVNIHDLNFNGSTNLMKVIYIESRYFGNRSRLELLFNNPKQSLIKYSINKGEASLQNVRIGEEQSFFIPYQIYGNPVTKIGSGALSHCTSLHSILIPDNVTEIGTCAFLGCTGLTSVVIPDSVKEIGESAFSGCTSLATITISDSLRNIGRNAFFECPKMPDSA